ncbi:MAG: substrate-binding domain-containing protein [Actinobacteria bacterium]|uniref:Unannotated protein n=1 Tax=freshwater metagenome TaxID=449393 RepID=A0A6J6MUL7_9ZZZZ|nr:substrate-binding domain-containing protein [Actinomycetota bacterium]
MVKRADVAALAGVSPSVVSYVLNGGPRHVSEPTRLNVLAAVKQLGYTPNALAAGLRRGATKTIGMIMPSPVNPYLAELADQIEEQAAELGYSIQISISRNDREQDIGSIRGLLDRQVDGLIVLSTSAFESLQALGRDQVPIVVIDHISERSRVSSVHVNNELESRKAVHYLHQLGHETIACLSGPQEVPTSDERISGWRLAQQESGFSDSDSLIVRAPYTAQGGWDATAELIDMTNLKPTAVFVASDAQAQGLLAALSERGISVPSEMSVISFDGSATSRFTSPPLTVVMQPAQEIVEIALNELLRKIAEPNSEPAHIVMNCQLIERASTAAPAR